MLIIARSITELSFTRLMEVYLEGNLENGNELWPELSEGEKLLRAEQEFYQYLTQVFFSVKGAVYAIWEKEGTYVSALRLEPYKDGLLLEALETKPDKRCKGYARKLVDHVLQWLKDQGSVRVYSHVSKKNLPSRKVHEACGFLRIQDYAVSIDGSVNSGQYTMLCEIEREVAACNAPVFLIG